jgi:hypothetical protein
VNNGKKTGARSNAPVFLLYALALGA